MSGAHHHRAAAWELYFTTTARLTERIEAALKCQAGLSMPEYSVLLMTDRAGEVGRTLSIDDFDVERIFGQEGVGILHLSAHASPTP